MNDSATITGTFSGAPNWTIDILDAANNTVKTYSGTNATLNVNWAGDNQSGLTLADGIYSVKVRNNLQLVGRKFIHVDNTLPIEDLDDALNGAALDALQKVLTGFATSRRRKFADSRPFRLSTH